MKHYNWIIALFVIIGLSGCKDTYNEHQDVTGTVTWKAGEKHIFKAAIENNTPEYDIFINLRHTPSVAFDNLDLNLKITNPDGKEETKAIALPVKRPNSNEMLGGCSGHLCDTETLIMPKYKFPATGTYTFEMTAKSKEDIPNILEVGLIIREIEVKK